MIAQIFALLSSTFWWILLLFIVTGIIKAFKPYLKGKEMGIFGSCGWSRCAWLNSWYNELHFAGARFPAHPLLAYGYPDETALKNCEELGKAVAEAEE